MILGSEMDGEGYCGGRSRERRGNTSMHDARERERVGDSQRKRERVRE